MHFLVSVCSHFIDNFSLECANTFENDYKNGSDIDLTLIGESLTYKIIGNIENDLDELYLPYTFYLSIYHLLENDKFIEHIGRVGKVFYEKVY